MVSQSERQAWANLGTGLSQVFQNWGQQRQNLTIFKAQMALRTKEMNEQAEYNDALLALRQSAQDIDDFEYEQRQKEIEARELAPSIVGEMPEMVGETTERLDTLEEARTWLREKGTYIAEGGEKEKLDVVQIDAALKLLGYPTEAEQMTRRATEIGMGRELGEIASGAGMQNRLTALREGIIDEQALVDRSWKTGWAAIIGQYPELDSPFYKGKYVEGINEAKIRYQLEQMGLEHEGLTIEQLRKYISLMGRSGGGGGTTANFDLLDKLFEEFGGDEAGEKPPGEYTDKELEDIAGG